MKVQNRTGLVALRPFVPIDSRPALKVAGYNPVVARNLLREGLAEEVELPKGVKYTEVAHTVGVRRVGPADPEESRTSLAHKLGPIHGDPTDPEGEGEGEGGAASAAGGPPDIPPDWEMQHHYVIIGIAKKLKPGNPKMKLDEAKAVIQEEQARRGVFPA